MAIVDQIVEEQTLSDTAVGAATKTFASTSVTQDDGASGTGKYMLVALVLVHSTSAGVSIDEVDYGVEDMAPDNAGTTSLANGRPAARIFSAGEWPTGLNDLVVRCSGGNIDDIVVHLLVLDEVADECLAPYGAAPKTDTFNRPVINDRIWTLDGGDGGGATADIVETGGIFRLSIFSDGITSSYFGGRGASLQQNVSNVDFDLALDKDTIGPSDGPLEGIVAEVAGNGGTYVIASHYEFGGANIYFARYSGGSETSIADTGSSDAASQNPRLERVGNDFEFFDSNDGSTFTSRGSTSQTMTVARAGIAFGGFFGATDTSEVFRFINRDGPTRDVQDAQTALEFPDSTVTAATTVSVTFAKTTNEGAGIVTLAIAGADDGAGTMSTGDDLIDEGLVGGIRYAIVGAVTDVSGATSGENLNATWAGSADAVMVGAQYRVDDVVVAAPSGIDLGAAARTSAVEALEISESLSIAVAARSSVVQPLAVSTAFGLGAATRDSTVQPVVISEDLEIQPAARSSTVQPLALLEAGEVDLGSIVRGSTVQPLAASEALPVGPVARVSTVQPLTISESVELGTVTRASSVQGQVQSEQLPIGTATRASVVQGIILAQQGAVALGTVERSQVVQSLAVIEALGLGVAARASTVQGLALDEELPLGTAVRTSTVQAVTLEEQGAIALGTALRASTVQPLIIQEDGVVALGVVARSSAVQPLALSEALPIGAAARSSTVQGVATTISVAIGTAARSSTVQPLAFSQQGAIPLTPANRSSTVQPLAIVPAAFRLGTVTRVSTVNPMFTVGAFTGGELDEIPGTDHLRSTWADPLDEIDPDDRRSAVNGRRGILSTGS